MADHDTKDHDDLSALALMQYADGELDEPEGAATEAGREQVLAIAELGDGVRHYVDAAIAEGAPDFSALWATVSRRIAANGVAHHEPVAKEVAREAPASSRGGFFAELGAWLDRYRGHFVTGAIAAGAAAALMVAIGGPPTPSGQDTAVATGPALPDLGSLTDPGTSPMALASTPPEVEQLEVYGGSGMVLTLPDEDGGGTAVIWLSGDDDATESPI
ncbi:MAG TPA: hypothetical protein VFG83_08835 [Kofleriaceae bacterium]|nr:hypothetical protein [Kofleriaceae bacterium]